MTNRISNLAAFTLPVPTPRPEEPQKQTAARVMDEHHMPSAPKTQLTEVSLCVCKA